VRGFVMEGTDLHLLDVTTLIPVDTLPTGINNHGQVVGHWARVHTLGFVAFPQDTP
jgi:hypothetical protein